MIYQGFLVSEGVRRGQGRFFEGKMHENKKRAGLEKLRMDLMKMVLEAD